MIESRAEELSQVKIDLFLKKHNDSQNKLIQECEYYDNQINILNQENLKLESNNIIDIINLKNTRDYILEPCVEYMTGNYKEHFNTDESKIYYKTLGMFILFCFIIMIFITLIHRIIK